MGNVQFLHFSSLASQSQVGVLEVTKCVLWVVSTLGNFTFCGGFNFQQVVQLGSKVFMNYRTSALDILVRELRDNKI
jgi:hypothetical protein